MLIFISGILLLSSCGKISSLGTNIINGKRGEMLMSDGQKADARMDQIVSAVKDKDREAIKSLFSQKALDEANDIDSGIDYLFDFIQGDIESWEREKLTSEQSIDYGKKSEMIASWYIINTEYDKYLFIIIDYSIDTIEPQNAGLYTVFAVKEEERDMHYTYWTEIKIAGIYKPAQGDGSPDYPNTH